MSYKYIEKNKTISSYLMLYFSKESKTRPIRKHRFKEDEAFFKEEFEEKD